jgi:hypothetical protein
MRMGELIDVVCAALQRVQRIQEEEQSTQEASRKIILLDLSHKLSQFATSSRQATFMRVLAEALNERVADALQLR